MSRINKYLSFIIFPVLIFSCVGNDIEEYHKPDEPANSDTTTVETKTYSQKAVDLFSAINQYYRISTGSTAGLYNENYPKRSSDNAASYLWPYDGLISGAATLYELGYDFDYPGMVDRFESYFSASGAVDIGGYSSQTNGSEGYGDRYYDDNSIVGIDLVEAYKLTDSQEYLDRAKRIVAFLKSGEDDTFGGGLWWNESYKNVSGNSDSNKPACANGFATLFLLKYYSVCPDDEKKDVLDFAKRLYEWLVDNLRDPDDGCYWNDKQASGEITKTKWTYNSGAMISNGVLLYKITGEQEYLDQASSTAEGSYNYFVRPNGDLALAYPDHDPWFTIKLVNSYIDIAPYYSNAKNFIDTFIYFLDYAYDHARTEEGFFYEDWTGASEGRSYSLLMQDAALESLGRIALYENEKIE